MSPATPTILHAGNPQELDEAVVTLLNQARRRVLICGQRLDPPVFRALKTCDSLARMIAQDLHNRVQVVVGEEKYFIERNRCLLELCRRFATHILARKMSSESEPLTDLFLVIDDRAYLHQPQIDTPVAVANLDARGRARQFAQRFEELWNHAEPISEISNLGLPAR